MNHAPERRPQGTHRLAARAARYGANTIVLSLATVGILIMLNVLAARYYRRFDMTQGRLHSLSPQSLQVLGELDADSSGESASEPDGKPSGKPDGLPSGIDIIGFYPDGRSQAAFEQWVDEYRAHTDALNYRRIDPIRQPGETERLGWDAYGPGLLVRRGERSQEVFYPDEQDITSALLKVSREDPKVVYMLSGHNEHSPTEEQGIGYRDAVALLEDNNYQIRSLNLTLSERVPDDAALLVIAGPRTPLLPGEGQRIQDYLLNGGKALILVDPGLGDPSLAAGPGSARSGWIGDVNALLEPWEVRFADATVVDPQQSLGGDPLAPALIEYGFHQITKDLANTLIALPLAAPILLPDASALGAHEAGWHYSTLATTSEQSWAESDLRAEPLQYDEGDDMPGPLVVAAAIEGAPGAAGERTTRLVLIGDSDLARNDVLAQIPNGQFLLLNAVNWLAAEEALIAIGPKTSLPQSIRLNRLQETAVSLGALVLIPAGIALAGVVVWSRRRAPARNKRR